MKQSKIRTQNKRQKPKKTHRFKMWRWQHINECKRSFKTLWRTPIATIVALGVFAVVLCLPVGLYWASDNLNTIGQQWQQGGEITLFLQDELPQDQAIGLVNQLHLQDNIAQVAYLSPEEALMQFNTMTDMGDALAVLDYNPLPAVLTILPADMNVPALERLQSELDAIPEVATASIDVIWVLRMQAILNLLQQSVIVLGVLLSLGLLFVVSNTIRSQLVAREKEIEVNKMVGASDSFVRRPFLYTGFWIGLLGSGFGLLVLTIGGLFLKEPLYDLLQAYASQWQPTSLGWEAKLSIVAISCLVAMAGAYIAVSRYLWQLRPR